MYCIGITRQSSSRRCHITLATKDDFISSSQPHQNGNNMSNREIYRIEVFSYNLVNKIKYYLSSSHLIFCIITRFDTYTLVISPYTISGMRQKFRGDILLTSNYYESPFCPRGDFYYTVRPNCAVF